VSEAREWWGTLRYHGDEARLRVVLIASFRRGGSELAGYPVIGSSGPKDYLKNQIWRLLQDTRASEVYLVRGRGPMFAIIRHGTELRDMDGRLVVLEQ
jgi:hypothetical protein